MSGGEIFLFIFLGLLLLVGIILTIYFVYRHDNKKNDQSDFKRTAVGSTGANGTNLTNLLPPGQTAPVNLLPGATGPGNNPPTLVTGNFSISPEMDSSAFMTFEDPIISGSRTPLPIIVPSDTSINCSKYSWRNVANDNFTSGLISNSRDIGGLNFPANLNSGSEANVRAILSNNTITNANWVYNITSKTWCSLANPNTCLFYQGPNPVSPNGSVFLNTLPTGNIPNNFKWNNISTISSPNCV